ncbi:hypothetical protein DSO57_1025028 [Entomophthora muscae]|uniref:Uncharacterized protein n=1 Tax=Entomophthora muscae TaxID=34485 RepID=A0ACC2UMS3_9FUNG|nr:hypothetical protein DSO57_1025028 [Entomophthora muscae]
MCFSICYSVYAKDNVYLLFRLIKDSCIKSDILENKDNALLVNYIRIILACLEKMLIQDIHLV